MISNKYKKLFLEVIPKRLHPFFKGGYYSLFPSENPDWIHKEYRIPETLPKKYIQDTEIVKDRKQLLTKLPLDGKVAELGVDKGDFSEDIISKTDPEKLYLIDFWKYNESNREIVGSKFNDLIDERKVKIIKSRSEVALEDFEDEYLDWVYIDTSHSYEQTMEELEISRRKVKNEGAIAGHDYCTGNPFQGIRYGVISAVHKFCVEYDWKISYLSLETHGHSSFILEKIEP